MAPVSAPGIDLQNLSSNWKALKATLPAKEGPTSIKRKRDDEQWTKNVRQRNNTGEISRTSLQNGDSHIKNQSGLHPRAASSSQNPSAARATLSAEHDIPVKDIAAAYGTSTQTPNASHEQQTSITHLGDALQTGAEAGKYIAIDCEMVGVGPNPDKESALARISLVNYHGQKLYDAFVRTKEPVTDYRTYVSGITPSLMKEAKSLEEVQGDVSKLLQDRILIGHSLRNDLSALLLSHPKRDTRDTSKHAPYRALAGGKTPSLKRLAKEILGIDIQRGEHSSVEDARATMLLFRHDKANFDLNHIAKYGQPSKKIIAPRSKDKKNSKKNGKSKHKPKSVP